MRAILISISLTSLDSMPSYRELREATMRATYPDLGVAFRTSIDHH